MMDAGHEPAEIKTQRARRVAFVQLSSEYGGMEVYASLFLRNLDPRRYDPVLIIPNDFYQPSIQPFVEQMKAIGIPFIKTAPISTKRGVGFMEDVWRLRQVFKEIKPDVVHIHTWAPHHARKEILAARLAGVPAIFRTENLSPSANLKRFTKYMVKPFDLLTNYIISPAEENRQEQLQLVGRKPSKLFLSYNGIELDRYDVNHDVAAAKRALNLDPNIPVVGAVGRLREQKGHTYLVAAAERIIKEYGAVNFVILGEGPLEQPLKEQVAKLGLEKYFHWVGLQREALLLYISAMDIAAMPSLHEGFSIVMLEFMAMGKPLIASDLQCFREATVPGESGLLVPSQNSDELATAIISLLRDPARAKLMGQKAAERVRTEFSIQRNMTDVMNLYDKVLGDKPARQPAHLGSSSASTVQG